MKKNLNTFICGIMCLLVIVILVACANGDLQNPNSKNKNIFIMYTDSGFVENDSFKVDISTPICADLYSGNKYTLYMYLTITNKEFKTNTYKIKNVSIEKESTSAKYTVNYDDEVTIEAELNQSISLNSVIPSSINDEKYKLFFEINTYKFYYYLYEIPDEYREDRIVKYFINDNCVEWVTIKDKRPLGEMYVYDSEDNLSYCDTWYIDEKLKNPINSNSVVTSDISLYGSLDSNIKWMTTGSDAYSFISRINHVPSNGILVFPRTYKNKELCIGNFAIKDLNVKEIYIPNTVRVIYGGNFTGINNAKIYYEGSKSEWESLFTNQRQIYTTNVVYNTRYNG